MSSVPFLSCCLSRQGKDQNKGSNMEVNKGILKDKLRNKGIDDVEYDSSETPSPEFGPKKTSKYDNIIKSKFSSPSSGKSKLLARREISTDVSLNGDRDRYNDNTMKAYSMRQWQKILRNNDLENTPVNHLLHSLRYGAPDELRPQIWEFLTNQSELKKQYDRDYYKTLKSTPNEKYDDQIKKDTMRTFPVHPYFKNDDGSANGEEILFNILRAYANHDPEIGYTQGMNYVVAKLLIIMEPDNYVNSELGYFDNYEREYEEKVFWLFMYIAQVKNCRQLYRSNFPKMHGMISTLDEKLEHAVPEIYEILNNSQVDLSGCFYSMFICLLMDSTPTPVAKRLLDLFFIEGENVIFKVIVRAILINKKDLMENADDAVKLHYIVKHELLLRAYKSNKDQLHVLFPGLDSMQ